MVNLKHERIVRNITQSQLSNMCSISRPYLNQLENGRVPWTVNAAKRVGAVLGIDWKDFFD